MPDIEPITICDPACGSGIMLLAAAGQFPPWAFHYGLVRLYGQDIDFTCVQMCRINLRLYGLGAMLVVGDALVEPRGDMTVEPLGEMVNVQDKEAHCGMPTDVEGQLSLFG